MPDEASTFRFVVVMGSSAGSAELKSTTPRKPLYWLCQDGHVRRLPHPVTDDLSAASTTLPLQTTYQPEVRSPRLGSSGWMSSGGGAFIPANMSTFTWP